MITGILITLPFCSCSINLLNTKEVAEPMFLVPTKTASVPLVGSSMTEVLVFLDDSCCLSPFAQLFSVLD
jgi:hypothetical protein